MIQFNQSTRRIYTKTYHYFSEREERGKMRNKKQNKKDMKGLFIYLAGIMMWAYLLISLFVGGAL